MHTTKLQMLLFFLLQLTSVSAQVINVGHGKRLLCDRNQFKLFIYSILSFAGRYIFLFLFPSFFNYFSNSIFLLETATTTTYRNRFTYRNSNNNNNLFNDFNTIWFYFNRIIVCLCTYLFFISSLLLRSASTTPSIYYIVFQRC